MRRARLTPVVAGLLALAALLPSAGVARAESRDASTVALGWQTENADEIVVATLVGDVPEGADFRVERSIKGVAAAETTWRVAIDRRHAAPAASVGAQHLLFLRRTAAAPGVAAGLTPLSGAFSVRPFGLGTPEARFPELVVAMRNALELKDPAALRGLLVAWMEDADPGVAWSAATDFVRHVELHADLSAPEGARIVAAYRRQPVGKNAKGALALAVAATRSPEAVGALVDSLLLPDAARIRGAVAEALRRMDAPAAAPTLAAALEGAAPPQRCALLGALSTVGGTAAAPAVKALLGDADAAVRVEAAAAIGGMARNARAKDPEARLDAAEALSTRVAGKAADELPENELRATLWALAQLDEAPAFDALRRVAAASERDAVRDYAARLLERPRQSLILARP